MKLVKAFLLGSLILVTIVVFLIAVVRNPLIIIVPAFVVVATCLGLSIMEDEL